MSPAYPELRDQFLDAFYQVQVEANSLGHLIDLLNAEGYDLTPPGSAGLKARCSEFLNTVLGRRGALQRVADILYNLDQSDASRVFAELVRKTSPREYLLVREKVDVVAPLESSLGPESLGRYYRAVAGRPPPEPLRDVWQLVCQLEADTPAADARGRRPADGQLDPLIHVLALASMEAGLEGLAATLVRRAEDYAARIDSKARPGRAGPSQGELQRQVLSTSQPGRMQRSADNIYIVLWLEPDQWQPEAFFVESWLYQGTEFLEKPAEQQESASARQSFRPPGLEAEVRRHISAAHRRGEQLTGADNNVVLEFVLPRRSLNMRVESWLADASDPDSPLGALYPVVIRDWDRQKHPAKRNPWLQKWRHLGDRPATDAVAQWFSCTDLPLAKGEVRRRLYQVDVSGAGLTFPPGPPDEAKPPPRHEFALGEMLNTGLPIAIWPHRCDHASAASGADAFRYAQLKQKFSEHSGGRPATDLPEIVRELRAEIADGDSALAGVALLWDDPRRRLRPDDGTLTVPGGDSGDEQ